VPIVLKSGSLNLLEPSGPVKACNGIALPLPLPVFVTFVVSRFFIDIMTQCKEEMTYPFTRKVEVHAGSCD
jgi:hypothetical protein